MAPFTQVIRFGSGVAFRGGRCGQSLRVPDLRDKQIKAGAQDAAKELGYRLTSYVLSDRWDGEVVYSFTFDAEGQEATVDLLIDEAIVHRSGLSLREYIRLEILDALENPDA